MNHTALTHHDELLQIAFLTSSITGPLHTINFFFLSHVSPRYTRLHLFSAVPILCCKFCRIENMSVLVVGISSAIGNSGFGDRAMARDKSWRTMYRVPWLSGHHTIFSHGGLLHCYMAMFLSTYWAYLVHLPTQFHLPSHLYNHTLLANSSVCVSVL